MSSYILRYYYISEEEGDISEQLTTISDKNLLKLIKQNTQPDFLKQTDFIYMFPSFINKMKIVLINIQSESECWDDSWKKLMKFDKELTLSFNEIMGKLTIFVNTTDDWSEQLNEDSILHLCYNEDVDELRSGPLGFLSWTAKTCEAYFCYTLSESESMAVTMLLHKLPYLYGKMIFLQNLSVVLNDRNFAIRQEKTELEAELISLLHTKLVIKQSSLQGTEELEKNIEWLASSFAKLVGNQNLNRDGIKRLVSKLDGLENNIKQDPNLNMYLNIFYHMTDTFHECLSGLQRTEEELSLIREEYKAAIDVVQTRIQVINGRTNIATQEQIKALLEVNTAMQKKSIIFQYAAGLIEFIVLAYYSHTLWSHLAHVAYTVIPTWIQFITVILFSGNTVVLTHVVAEYFQGDTHVIKKMIMVSISLTLIFILILYASTIAEIKFANH